MNDITLEQPRESNALTDPDSTTVRHVQRLEFLKKCGADEASLRPMPQDASFRRYFRVTGASGSCLLMDAPAPNEDVAPFIKVAKHLEALGLRPPRIFETDEAKGFVLLEDLGHDTFTRLLRTGLNEQGLYEMATDVVSSLHRNPHATGIDLAYYSVSKLVEEACLLVDWYYPAVTGRELDLDNRQGFISCIKEIVYSMPGSPDTLVLRDFHVDNLMAIKTSSSTTCALLDFQDALIGPPAYDLVSLLEDARRDIDEPLAAKMLDRYFAATPDMDRASTMRWYRFLGAQRHAKVLGIFMRLYVRDGKATYLEHLPRVMGLLNRHLDSPDLAPLKHWLDQNMPWRNDRIPRESDIKVEEVRAVSGSPFEM